MKKDNLDILLSDMELLNPNELDSLRGGGVAERETIVCGLGQKIYLCASWEASCPKGFTYGCDGGFMSCPSNFTIRPL